MYHCAAAALFAAGGVGKRKDVPKSHEHVLEHFGKLVRDEPGDLGEAGRLLSHALSDRMTADYGLIEGVSEPDAAETAADAVRFVEVCTVRWKLKDLLPPRFQGAS
ncbi:MAG: hypothetical protein JWP35_1570 [Caulobacter sp.]|nr:hypothetical protein [Caulobacter sp.]